MKKHFYTHLVNTTDITLEIAQLNVGSDERVHLLSLAHANIHSSIVSKVLSNLEAQDKKIFLQNLSSQDHDKTWSWLKGKIAGAEKLIEKTIGKTVSELLEDVKKTKS